MIYDPAEDSLLLAKCVKQHARGKNVLDIGCGSGILMEMALANKARSVQGVDIDSEVVAFCKEKGLDVLESDLFSNVSGTFDLIVFNPPYLPEDEREDRESARITSGGTRGDEIILRFLKESIDYLSSEGVILLLVSSLTPSERITQLLSELQFETHVLGREKVFMETLEVWKLTQKV